MVTTSGDEGLAILQLHKWASAEVIVNPLEFREAFISPSRQHLLLHSYQCEALLLPLVKGNICILSSSIYPCYLILLKWQMFVIRTDFFIVSCFLSDYHKTFCCCLLSVEV